MVFFLLFPFLISSLHQVPPLASIKRPTASPFVSGCASSSRAEDGANEHRGHGENTEIFQIKAPLPFKWFQHQRLSGPRPSPHKNTVNSTGKKLVQEFPDPLGKNVKNRLISLCPLMISFPSKKSQPSAGQR